jgi:hypothetical protein
MPSKKNLRPLPKSMVKIFKIVNRRGFAALCKMNLTEGSSPLAAYLRMQKAVKRAGFCLPDIDAAVAKGLVKKNI